MKTLKFLIFAVLALSTVTACSENDTPEQENVNISSINGIWEVKTIDISSELANIGSPPENALYSNILITISVTAQEQIVGEGHTFYNMIGFTFEIKEHQQISFITYGGTRIAEDEWGRAFSDHIRYVVKFDISNNELKFMDSQNNPVIVFIKKD
jgi:hypothetical protein